MTKTDPRYPQGSCSSDYFCIKVSNLNLGFVIDCVKCPENPPTGWEFKHFDVQTPAEEEETDEKVQRPNENHSHRWYVL